VLHVVRACVCVVRVRLSVYVFVYNLAVDKPHLAWSKTKRRVSSWLLQLLCPSSCTFWVLDLSASLQQHSSQSDVHFLLTCVSLQPRLNTSTHLLRYTHYTHTYTSNTLILIYRQIHTQRHINTNTLTPTHMRTHAYTHTHKHKHT